MRYKCGLCMISPSCQDTPTGTREEIVDHLEGHGVLDIELYLTKDTGEQADLEGFA